MYERGFDDLRPFASLGSAQLRWAHEVEIPAEHGAQDTRLLGSDDEER